MATMPLLVNQEPEAFDKVELRAVTVLDLLFQSLGHRSESEVVEFFDSLL